MRRSDFTFIIKLFLSWRGLLFAVAFLATLVIPNFGNRFPYADRVLTITGLPNWIWGFGNFDGVHYLKIAQDGYRAWNSQAFFPLYPFLIRFLNFFPRGSWDKLFYVDPSYFYTAMILSTVFFVAALYFLFKLWQEEHGPKTTFLAFLLLLSFPTAFYFGAVYSESLFLLLVVLTFWFVKKDKFILAGFTAALASATKIQGALLFIFLAVELWEKHKDNFKRLNKKFWLDLAGVAISPLGLGIYMSYLYRVFRNPLYFLAAQPGFGAQRSSYPFILLPQVFYRYLKIFFSVKILSLSFFNAFLEFFVTVGLIVVLIAVFKRMKFSYWIFSILAVILPTLTGTFSSMPRYALLAFMVLPNLAVRFKKKIKYIVVVQSVLQVILLSMFIRGYWVS